MFIDVDGIQPGQDFTHVIADQVAKCDVVLAVIGKGWIDSRDEQNVKRLDNPGDFVRIEIASALEQNKRVIPVLVGSASMPREQELPDVLKPLALRQAVRLTNDRFKADAEGLVKALCQMLDHEEQRKAVEKAGWFSPASRRKMIAGALCVMALLIVALLADRFLPERLSRGSAVGELGQSPAATKSCLTWVGAKDGMIPDNAIVGGKEPSWSLYVCRARVGQDLLPGKLVPGWACYAGSNGSEQVSHDYEVLTGKDCAIDWVDAPGGVPSKDSIQGGTEAGQAVLICRANLSVGAGGLHIGRYGWSTNHQCVMSYGGKQYSSAVFQTLTAAR